MHTYQIQKATTDVSIELRIIDDTDGTPETGVVWNTSGIDLQYRRDGAASTAITEATLAALTTAHTDGGFLHIGNGVYRFDLPDAACATGVDKVTVHGTVTGMVVIGCVIQLVSYDPFDAVRLGLTALPDANADAAGGLPISDAGGLDLDTQLATTDQIGAAGAGLTNINLPNQTMDITGNLSGSVGSVTGAAGSVTGAVGSVAGNVDGSVASVTAINTTGGAIDNVTLVATTTTNTDMRGTDGANTVVPDAAGVAPTAVENRQEMDSNSTQLAAIVLDTGTTLPAQIDGLGIKKNTAFSNYEFLVVLTSDHVTPATGLTVTGQRSIDGGAFAGVSGTIAEVSNGIYQFDALAADTNGDVITWRFSSATADDVFETFKTI